MANIELRVRGQRLLMVRGYVVAGTVRYLTIKAALSEDWRGREVWAYLEFGDKKYKTQLNANGESTARAGLNLSAGEWSIYLMGYGKDADGNVNTNSPSNNNYARPDLWRTRDCEATRMVHHTKEAAYYICHERQR